MKTSGGLGGGVGLGYTYFISAQVGISTGLEFSLSSTTVTADKFHDEYKLLFVQQGREEEDMILISNYDGYKEKQSATYLHIPVMARFQTTAKNKFYTAAGFKLGFALSGSSDATVKSLTASGHFPQTDVTIYDEDQHGLTIYPNVSYPDDLSLGFDLSLAVEAGMRWELTEKLGLYTGAFLDYGVLNILPELSGHLIDYNPNPKGELTYHSILDTKLLSKANLFCVGIKVGLAF
jgi:hypothetical protein